MGHNRRLKLWLRQLLQTSSFPTEFAAYAIERTAEHRVLFGQCGIIETHAEFDELAAGGGTKVEMPFWKDLTATGNC